MPLPLLLWNRTVAATCVSSGKSASSGLKALKASDVPRFEYSWHASCIKGSRVRQKHRKFQKKYATGPDMTTTNTYSNEAAPQSTSRSFDLHAPWTQQALSTAIACLGVAYVLSWAEMGLALMVGPDEPLAPLVASRILVGGLYACVAMRFQWARWTAIALGVASIVIVGPMLAAEWRVLPTAAVVTGAVLVAKLAASIFLLSPNAGHEKN
jgi:hypothetical protein